METNPLSNTNSFDKYKVGAKPTVTYKDFLDIDSTRDNIFNNVLGAVGSKYPISNEKYSLEIHEPKYEKNRHYTLDEQKSAILDRQTLDWPLYGTWRLRDKATGNVMSEQRKIIARVPYMTPRGTFILRGNEYTLSNQQRLRPGIYARKKDNGELEAHVNLMPGTGASFRVYMEPETGLFKLKIGQANIPAYPILKALGASDEDMLKSWGPDILTANTSKNRNFDLAKVYEKLASSKVRRQHSDPIAGLKATFAAMGVDPEVSHRNLGQPFEKIEPAALIRTMQKLLKINKGEEEQDDRDSQANMTIHGPEDLIAERISKDAGALSRNLLWKVSNKRTVDNIPSAYLTRQINAAIMTSGLGSALSEINPMEILHQLIRVSRLGEGAITSKDAVPDEARNVQPSQLGLIDPVLTPESISIGIDSRLAMGTMKGSDGQIYRKVLDKSGKEKLISGRDMIHSVVAFPGEMEKPNKNIRASIGGKIEYVDRNKVDYIIPSARDMFSYAANMVPMLSGIKGGRLLMGGKMIAQALPLQNPEAPLVQSDFGDGTSFENFVGKFMGNQRASQDGRVVKVTPDGIDVVYADKTKGHVQLYNSFPLNQKTSLTNQPLVKAGDTFKANQLLANSNFTDKNGTAALGTNLRTAYMVMKGNFEDAIVISESAAKKLASEHMYLSKIPVQENLTVDKKAFVSNFPGKYTQVQLDTLDDNGVVKPGTVLHHGDPIAVGVNKREPTKGKSILKQARSWNIAFTETWDHEQPGLVTDVSTRGGGIKVATKTFIPMKVGDKMVSRYANKGIVSKIYPDDQMPRHQDGQAFEVVFNPLGIISRVNNSLLAETALAKIARKTGQPYVMPGFTDKSLVQYALDELKKHNIPETDTVYDPGTNKELKNIFTGEQFIMKLHHTAEGKTSGRDVGVYSMDNTPAKGQVGQSKRIGSLEMNALLAHNVPAVIRDAKLIRGQRNDDYWRKFRLGLPVPTPNRPFVYDKFLAMLKSAGVNVDRRDDKIHVTAMGDKDVDRLAGDNELTSGDAINLKTMEPVKGGLFDVGLTGGRDSQKRWAKITLAEPVPNPTMEEPIRRLLGLTGPKFEALLKSPNGPEDILHKLKSINLDDAINNARQTVKSGKSSKRDNAVKLLQYLTTAKRIGSHPSDWMITKVPVLPAAFRPISHVDGMELTSDANLLYKDLFEANKNLKELKGEGIDIGDDRMATYDAVKAVVGLGDPINIKNKEKSVAGMLTHIFGKSSPKFGMFQQKLLSTTVDIVGRAVISPDPKLDMDQVGIPANVAWDIYRPHIMRRLARKYNAGPHKVDLTELAKWIVSKDPRAKKALEEEMENRPVMISRAPVWHKFGIMGAWPVLAEGNTMKLPPLVYPGFGADNDGDAMNFHVPASDEAVQEVIQKMLPSKNLISTGDFKLQMQPKQEFLLGLYLATKDTSKRHPRTFESKEAAIQAALQGKIEFNDPVIIKGK